MVRRAGIRAVLAGLLLLAPLAAAAPSAVAAPAGVVAAGSPAMGQPAMSQPAMVQPAAASTPAPLRLVAVDTSRYPAVDATAVVPRLLAGQPLAPEQWSVSVDGRPRAVTVAPVPAGALAVVLVVDTVLPPEELDGAVAALVEFVRRLPAAALVGVVDAGAATPVVLPATRERPAVLQALSRLTPSDRSRLRDAVLVAAEELPTEPGSSRHLVGLVAGPDTTSRASTDGVTAELSERAVSWSAVTTGSAGPDDGLPSVAAATAGRVERAQQTPTGALDRVADDLVARYRLSFLGGTTARSEARIAVSAYGTSAETTLTVPVDDRGRPPDPTAAAPAAASDRSTSAGPAVVGGGLTALALLGVGGFVLSRRRRAPRPPR